MLSVPSAMSWLPLLPTICPVTFHGAPGMAVSFPVEEALNPYIAPEGPWIWM
jgi:hypothetical protein